MTIKKIVLSLVALFACVTAQAQTLLNQTTLAAAITSTTLTTIAVTSATGFAVNNIMYSDREAMRITAINGTLINVVRGASGTPATTHLTLAPTFQGSPSAFTSADVTLSGSCTAANTYAPTINTRFGDRYMCIANSATTASWQKNPYKTGIVGEGNVTTAVASAAGLVVVTSPLFHITGALAITGFTLGTAFEAGSFCVIPDGAFTTTTATNIAIASTGVVSKLLCFAWDTGTTKWYPTY